MNGPAIIPRPNRVSMTLRAFDLCFSLATWREKFLGWKEQGRWTFKINGTHIDSEGIDGCEKGRFSHSWDDPDGERESEERVSLVDPLKETKTNVGQTRNKGADKEKIPRPNALYVLPKDGGEHNSCEEDAAINLKK